MIHGKKNARIVSLATVLLAGGLVALAGIPLVGFKAAPPPTSVGPAEALSATAPVSDPGPELTPRLGGYSNSGCLGYDGDRDWEPTWICPGDDDFMLTVSGSTLFVQHINAEYNCCPADIAVTLVMEGDKILLTEVEIPGEPCDCNCCYEVESSVVDLGPGTYTVIYCWYDYYTWEDRCEEILIVIESQDGQKVASDIGQSSGDQILVGGPCAAARVSKEAEPYVISYSNSGCLGGSEREWWPCEEDDTITFTAGAGTLHTLHSNAAYNCCLDDIAVSVTMDGNTILLMEDEILTQPCFCICCYDAESTVAGLAPGTYTVVYYWEDYEMGPRCFSDTVVIP